LIPDASIHPVRWVPAGKPGFACAANITINAGITTDDD